MQVVQMARQQHFASSPLQLEILRAGKSDRPQIFHRNRYNLSQEAHSLFLRSETSQVKSLFLKDLQQTVTRFNT